MGDRDTSVELDSIRDAVGVMTVTVVDRVADLREDWASYLDRLHRDEWSPEQSCLAFGNSYVSAIEAYDAVLQAMAADVTRYRDELQATYEAYRDQDDAVTGRMNARLAALDDVGAADDAGRTAYRERPDLDDGTAAPAPAPTDTSPGPGV